MKTEFMGQLDEKQKDAFSKAAALCSRSEKSPAAILQKLQQWGLADDECDSVMAQLFQHKFLDEERFARSYVRDKFRFNEWGRIKIAFHLKAERIPVSVIQQAMEEIDDNTYLETLQQLLKDKVRKTKAANAYDLKAKVFRFAQSRGFEPDLIYTLLDGLIGD